VSAADRPATAGLAVILAVEGRAVLQDRLELPGFAVRGVLDPELVLLGGDSHSLVSRVEAHVLHADDFLALMLADGVPDGHVVGGQVQLVGAGQGVVLGEGSARDGSGSSSR
jgi:hypothetical protein